MKKAVIPFFLLFSLVLSAAVPGKIPVQGTLMDNHSDGFWHIRSNIANDSPADNWTVWVMFVRKEFADCYHW